MSLIHVKILGKSVDDRFVFKVIVGSICMVVLLVVLGQDSFINWVLKSLVIWIAVTCIVVALTYGFVEESFTWYHIMIIVVGIVVVVLFSFFSGMTPDLLALSVLQSLVWMTFFSIITEGFRRRIDR